MLHKSIQASELGKKEKKKKGNKERERETT